MGVDEAGQRDHVAQVAARASMPPRQRAAGTDGDNSLARDEEGPVLDGRAAHRQNDVGAQQERRRRQLRGRVP